MMGNQHCFKEKVKAMQSNIKVVTENFRAIGHAAIQISGITVVAGENSSGKSTLSKLLYYLFNTSSNYEVLVKRQLFYEFEDLLTFVRIIYTDFREQLDHIDFVRFNKLFHETTYSDLSLEDIKLTFFLFLEKTFQKISFQNSNRYNQFINRILSKETGENNNLESLKKFVENKFKNAEDLIKLRPISLFTQELSHVFQSNILPKTFEVSEEEEVIVALNKPTLSISFSVNKAIYIDTPMSLLSPGYYHHWHDLNTLLKKQEDTRLYLKDILSLISENIQGEAQKDSLYTSDFSFTRSDGKTFDLNEVATGIKAFSIIQLLLKNGHIDNRTLLIIDEPESHLHPQWIVEYARMIVLLHKHIGVKFFLASHNPDMVSAIRYIAEKEGVLDNVNYYLAKKTEEDYLYNYRALGSDIAPILGSFHKDYLS